ncbi:hypothetical protein HORIV_42510 [Vreelandella olivaria]|uniref:Uncharacterized protein n=1 Tax=Vreelandella olivaria TaxID=390919 RepID=A0ABN5X3Z0_9GAMM|nr:hypothetical protein HORIV_42510 [Halomonas olivaria]
MVDLGVVVDVLAALTEEQAQEIGFRTLAIQIADQVVAHQRAAQA